MRTSLSAAVLTASLVLTLPALAQEHALPRYEMAPTGDRFFGVHAPSVPGHLDLHAGAVLDYAHKPFVLRETATGDVVSSYVDHQLLLHTGVTFALWNRLALSAALPVALSQGGDDPRYLGVTQSSPDKAAAGDLRTSARFALVGEHDSTFQVGVGAHLWLPTGSNRLLMSDGTVRAMPYLALGGRLGPEGRAIWNVFGGPELRPSRDLLGAELGTMIRGGAGAAYQVGPRRDVQLGGELNGYVVPREPSSRTTGIELLLSAKLRFLDDFEAGLAAGPGLVGGVGAPSFRGLLGLAYTPRLPESRDRDSTARADVPPPAPAPAPPLDSDGDGVADDIDACPSEKGDPDGPRPGCPAAPPPPPPEPVATAPTDAPAAPPEKPKIEDRVMFALDSADIDANGQAAIARVAKAMASRPDARVVIQGHTDDTGTVEYNQALSERRSHAVRDALLRAGVSESRMETQGLGPSQPFDTSGKPEARAQNRRVDFRVVD
ncbi:MAG: OmpA family protein [Labilithrix sp.]|nr:OmpA family protein [Labilithrix sp.]